MGVFRVLALALALAVPAATAPAGGIKLKSSDKRSVTVALPGGTAKLALVGAWGRTRKPNKAWKAEGDKLPATKTRAGKGWVELSVPFKPAGGEFIRICSFTLDLSGAKGWADPGGKRTHLRRGNWRTAADLLAKRKAFPKAWAWPAAPGLTRLRRKEVGAYAMGREDVWTGFSGLRFKGMGRTLAAADLSAVVRTSGSGAVLGLIANRAISVGFEGPDKLTVSAVARNLKAGRSGALRVRLFLGNGKPGKLAEGWARSMDSTLLRVFFAGDSVGAEKDSYAVMLAARLSDEFGARVRSLNTSRGGDTTAGALKEYQQNILDYRPNVVVIQLCYNDVGKIKPGEVAANLKKMIAPLLARPGGRALIMTPLSYDKKRVDATLKKGVDINKMHTGQYIPALQKLVAAYQADPKTRGKVGFANIWKAMAAVRAAKGADHVLLPDGSHPRKEGHTIIADCAWPELKRLSGSALKELGKPGAPSDGR